MVYRESGGDGRGGFEGFAGYEYFCRLKITSYARIVDRLDKTQQALMH
jgi:hypothetical protein